MKNETKNPIKKIFEETVNEIINHEVESQKFYSKQFKIIPCDIVKETEDIIKTMKELLKLKFEKCDLVKRYNISELEEKLKKLKRKGRIQIS